MKICIMQPYLFPYLGYYQMLYHSDVFLSYNDVDYIQRGWINRNRLLINKEIKYFTVPVKKEPLGTLIKDIEIKDYHNWLNTFLNTLKHNYSKAEFYRDTVELIEHILNQDFKYIYELSFASIRELLVHFGFKGDFYISQNMDMELSNLTKEEKLEKMLNSFNAKEIILPSGSVELYKDWHPKGINKRTLKHSDYLYNAFNKPQPPNLSIIDLMMHNDINTIKNALNEVNFI